MYLDVQASGSATKTRNNEEPAQGKRNLFVHVIRAGHEGVGVEQKLVIAEKNPGSKTKQKNYGDYADEAGTGGARQQQGARVPASSVPAADADRRNAHNCHPRAVAQKTSAQRIASTNTNPSTSE